MKLLGVRGVVVAATLFSAVPFSPQWSPEEGLSVSLDRAYAIVGRPATPRSVPGIARRTTRRLVSSHRKPLRRR